MAGDNQDEDKSQEPTQRKIEEAIKRGDVAKSVEINTLFVLGGLMLVIMIMPPSLTVNLSLDLRGFLMNAHQVPSDSAGFMNAGTKALIAFFSALAVPAGIIALLALAGGMIQSRPIWTPQPLAPQMSRISPLAGFKRIFGKEAWVQFIKGLLKIALVGSVSTYVLWGERDRLDVFVRLSIIDMLAALKFLVIEMLGVMLGIFAILAIGDFVYQRFAWRQRQRMSFREIKEEYKQSEGNPEVKGRMKQIRMAKLRKRMMANVPKAAVVITNPTHYAVALQYETGMAAPICLAKGVDSLALRIRKLAEEHNITIVENPPLARALHASVDIDEEIPVEHYKAVAEVIGYVMRLKRRAS